MRCFWGYKTNGQPQINLLHPFWGIIYVSALCTAWEVSLDSGSCGIVSCWVPSWPSVVSFGSLAVFVDSPVDFDSVEGGGSDKCSTAGSGSVRWARTQSLINSLTLSWSLSCSVSWRLPSNTCDTCTCYGHGNWTWRRTCKYTHTLGWGQNYKMSDSASSMCPQCIWQTNAKEGTCPYMHDVILDHAMWMKSDLMVLALLLGFLHLYIVRACYNCVGVYNLVKMSCPPWPTQFKHARKLSLAPVRTSMHACMDAHADQYNYGG